MIYVVDEEKEFTSEKEEVTSTEQEKTGKKPGGWKKRIKRILNVIEWIALIAGMIIMIYIFSHTLRGKAASFFGTSILHVVTGSMEPTIPVDDFIIVKKTDVNSLEKDDIIAFYSENPNTKGLMVIHRIMQINEDGSFVTKGDANTVEDAVSVTPDKVIGEYAGDAWFLNWLVSFVSLRKLLLMLVIIPMFFISIYEVRTLAKLFKEDDEKPSETDEEKIERLKKEAIEEYKKEHEGENSDSASTSDDVDVKETVEENTSEESIQLSEIDELVKKYGTNTTSVDETAPDDNED